MKTARIFSLLGLSFTLTGVLLSCDDHKPRPAPTPIVVPSVSAPQPTHPPVAIAPVKSGPTEQDVEAFIRGEEPKIKELLATKEKTTFLMETNITYDSEVMDSQAREAIMAYLSAVTPKAVAYLNDPHLKLSAETTRKLQKLVLLQAPLPSPTNPQQQKALANVATELESSYGKIQFCLANGPCFGQKEAEARMGSKEYMIPAKQDVLLETWVNWHNQGRPLRKPFIDFVQRANQAAQDLHYKDLGELWRADYDMTPAEFEKEVERLWTQVEPLYKSLHCYVRAKLSNYYGKDKVPLDGPIPAHLLGNLWAQEWAAIYPIVAPSSATADTIDVGALLQTFVDKKLSEETKANLAAVASVDKKAKQHKRSKLKIAPLNRLSTSPEQILADAEQIQEKKKKTAVIIASLGEGFFDSLGLGKLPETFWERSMLVKPRDRKVVCHASADDLGMDGDVRLKMCIEPTTEDFRTIHHELGHDYYFLAYKSLSPLFQNSANDGFHEAVGDSLTFSITPEYLVKIGLLDKVPASNPDTDIQQLLKDALSRVAFLPFGKVLDQWRWNVFSGKIKPENYNQAYWDLRTKYQGIVPPVARTEEDFDPGAKYHIPANVPYTRYFLARILQFQFHKALCQAAGYQGPLHKCSIYGSKEAGKKLSAMLSMGASRPWPEALQAISGETKMDAGALLEFYQPLMVWLNEQNKDQKCGW